MRTSASGWNRPRETGAPSSAPVTGSTSCVNTSTSCAATEASGCHAARACGLPTMFCPPERLAIASITATSDGSVLRVAAYPVREAEAEAQKRVRGHADARAGHGAVCVRRRVVERGRVRYVVDLHGRRRHRREGAVVVIYEQLESWVVGHLRASPVE